MYELHTAVWTLAVLDQKMIGLATEETATMGTGIVLQELTAEFLAFLGNLGRIPVSLDKKNNRNYDGYCIENKIPYAFASGSDTQDNGHHRDQSCSRAERIELALIDLQFHVLTLVFIPHFLQGTDVGFGRNDSINGFPWQREAAGT